MNIFQYHLFVFFTCFALLGGVDDDHRLKIVFFGDSITSVRSNVDSVFAQRVPTLLARQGVDCEPIISGTGSSHSGTLADNDFAKVRHALDRFESDVLAHCPDVVVIGFGSNDAYIDGSDIEGESRIPLEKFEANLRFMITSLQAKGVMVLLRTPPPFAFPENRMYQDRRLHSYVDAIRRLAKQYKTGLADNYLLFQTYGGIHNGFANLLPDGVHPNDEGHALIAESVSEELLKVLKRNTAK